MMYPTVLGLGAPFKSYPGVAVIRPNLFRVSFDLLGQAVGSASLMVARDDGDLRACHSFSWLHHSFNMGASANATASSGSTMITPVPTG